MKWALCLSGQARFVKESFDDIKYHIIDVVKPDIYIHTWHEDTSDLGIDYNALISLYKPKHCIIEKQIEFDTDVDTLEILDFHEWNKDQLRWMYKRVASMFYSASMSSRKVMEDNYYDFIIKCRTDLLPTQDIMIDNLDKETLYCHMMPLHLAGYNSTNEYEKRYSCKRFFGDQIAYGSYEVMRKYFDIYWHFEYGIIKTGRLNAGSVLSYYLNKESRIKNFQSNSFLDSTQDRIFRNGSHRLLLNSLNSGAIPNY